MVPFQNYIHVLSDWTFYLRFIQERSIVIMSLAVKNYGLWKWMVCGWSVNGLWMVSGWSVDSMRMACGWSVDGLWMVSGKYADGLWMI
jgi:hypothetical protein